MAQINPHINFNGNAEKAFTFYKSVYVIFGLALNIDKNKKQNIAGFKIRAHDDKEIKFEF